MNQNWKKWWGGLLVLTLVGFLLLGFYLRTELQKTNSVLGSPLDDAWIHFQFARNLSQGNGFSFNPGEPTPGSTAPLWTVLLAPIGLVSQNFLFPALALSAFFFLASIWLSYGFAYWLTSNLWAAFLTGIGVALAGRLLWAGLAGMETTAFAALSIGAIWAYSRWGLRLFPTLLFALAAQLRPEGHALFGLALADAVLGWWKSTERPLSNPLAGMLRLLGGPLLLYLVIAAPYSLFSLAVTGKPLPNTFYAKVGSEYIFSWRTLRETAVWHWQDNFISIILAAFGILPLWRQSRLSVLWLLGLPLMTALIIDFTWHHGRYTMPLIPLQMVAAGVGADWLFKILNARVGPVKSGHLFSGKILPLVLVGLIILGGMWRFPYWARMLGNNVREIQDIDIALGKWFEENTPKEAVIAVDDIGAIGFLSNRRIVDMNGLVSPEVWPALQEDEGLPRNQMLTRILSQLKPDYMAAFPLWRWDIATNSAVSQPIHHVHTDTHTIIFQQDAMVYRSTWPYINEWKPEQAPPATFGDGIQLLGYELLPERPAKLIFYWQSLSPVSKSYDYFVHLVDAQGAIVAQVDQKPLGGLAATDVWQTGDIIRDPVELPIPDDLPPGSYDLFLGFYLRETGERIEAQGVQIIDQAVYLTSLDLP